MINVSAYRYTRAIRGLSNIYTYYLEDEVFDNIGSDCYIISKSFIDGVEVPGSLLKLYGRYYRLSDMGVDYCDSVLFNNGFILSSKTYIDGGSYIKTYCDNGFLSSRSYYNSNHDLHNERGYAYEWYDVSSGVSILSRGTYWLGGRELNKEEWEDKMLVKLYW